MDVTGIVGGASTLTSRNVVDIDGMELEKNISAVKSHNFLSLVKRDVVDLIGLDVAVLRNDDHLVSLKKASSKAEFIILGSYCWICLNTFLAAPTNTFLSEHSMPYWVFVPSGFV